jgi:cysteine desulfurase/selenocysteine lyase
MTEMNVGGDFDLAPGRVWLNTSHQGALPRVAAEAARRAVEWKLRPHKMTTDRFGEVPRQLKQSIGRLIGVPGEDVILTNGASYGIHLLANGLSLKAGDEVLLMEGDFPSNLLPWRAAVERGVQVKLLRPRGPVLSPGEIEAALSPRTRMVCLTWVHSFSGHVHDITAIGELCRRNGTWFAVNASQAIGVRALQVVDHAVDAIFSVGWKYLCGPYATGFAWLRESLRASLDYNQAYWLAAQNEASLREANPEFTVPGPAEARRYDVFGTANFFNFLPLTASIDFLLALGIHHIQDHVGGLVKHLTDGLDRQRFKLISGGDGESQSSLVLFRHADSRRQEQIHQALAREGYDVALRMGRLRISPHLYNTHEDIAGALEVLDRAYL